MTESIVQKKLGKLIQVELSQILSRERFSMPGVLLTVSVVRVTGDLSLAKVYISVFPDEKLEDTVSSLDRNTWEIRHQLASRIRNKMRKMPEIRFYVDDSFREADRINRLLDELNEKGDL